MMSEMAMPDEKKFGIACLFLYIIVELDYRDIYEFCVGSVIYFLSTPDMWCRYLFASALYITSLN